MIGETNNQSSPMTAEAAVLLYKTDKVGEFLNIFPETSLIFPKTDLADTRFSIQLKKAALDLEHTERELKKLGLELKQEMNKSLKVLERIG
ncbi:hypothetical protein [Bacillus sp. SJS]|uniref:hypothetical protein n=1 Tax=Bacillus sp. SJS TaxID=1423321 RepID=UPI0004DD7932|nr:hypothetical protein [Bacillus sp. SJS]KZZ83049.1 hypothetical protein AS29_019880 [Bacillus sp. SJS]